MHRVMFAFVRTQNLTKFLKVHPHIVNLANDVFWPLVNKRGGGKYQCNGYATHKQSGMVWTGTRGKSGESMGKSSNMDKVGGAIVCV